jgi:hypothetical protein
MRLSRPASRIWQIRWDNRSTTSLKPCSAAWLKLTSVSNGVFPYFRRGLALQCSRSRMLIVWRMATRSSWPRGRASRCQRTGSAAPFRASTSHSSPELVFERGGHMGMGDVRSNRVGRDSSLRAAPRGRWPPEATADELLMLTISKRGYVWWPDTVSPAVLPEVRSAETAKHVTDRYLLGLARRNGGRVVTFDRALATSGGDDAICLLPANR